MSALVYPDQPIDCQRFQGQKYPSQHTHSGPVKNAIKCGICGSSADKLETGLFVCQANGSHMADPIIAIWSNFERK